MFDLSRILRIRVLGISFDDSPLNLNNDKHREEMMIWNTQNRVSSGWESIVMYGVLGTTIRVSHYSVNGSSGHPLIESISTN